MSTGSKPMKRDFTHTRGFLLAFCIFLGVLMFGASAIGGHVVSGLGGFGVMAILGCVFFFGSRSETIRGLRGDGRDERFAEMDLRATALSGGVLMMLTIGGFLVEIARGHSGAPFTWMGAIAGLTYIAGVIYIRLRG